MRLAPMGMHKAIIDDDDKRVLRLLRDVDGPNLMVNHDDGKYPTIGHSGAHVAALAAFCGSVKCVRLFINLSFDHNYVDLWGVSLACFGVAGGSFDICRE
jgi:hypothetical protein